MLLKKEFLRLNNRLYFVHKNGLKATNSLSWSYLPGPRSQQFVLTNVSYATTTSVQMFSDIESCNEYPCYLI